MILELLKYFAKYPTKAGVLNLFKQGESSLSGYADLPHSKAPAKPGRFGTEHPHGLSAT